MTTRHSLRLLSSMFVAASITMCAGTIGRAAQNPPPMSADLAAAQAFLYFAYPDLFGRPVTFTFNQTDGKVIVSVALPRNPLSGSNGERPEALIDATIAFSPDHRVLSFAATGALLGGTMNRALREMLLAQPGWTDEQAEAWLVESGASAGPQQSAGIAARVTAASWQPYLGANALRGDPVFKWRDDAAAGAGQPFRGAPAWVVPVTAGETGARVTYQLEFEPFGGRLVAVVRQ